MSVDHTPAFRRLKAPVNRGQLQRCLPLPTVTSACLACAGERTALSCRPRRSRRPSAPWSGGGDLSGGSSHRSVQTCAYHLKRDIAALSLKDSDTPGHWAYKMQLLLKLWKQLPPGKRGGTIADLSDALLDKVPATCRTYVQYVRAFSSVNKKGLVDYQGVCKMLVDQHTEQRGATGDGGSDRRGAGKEPFRANMRTGGGGSAYIGEAKPGEGRPVGATGRLRTLPW